MVPLLKVSLNKKRPIGLSIMSGRSEPISKSLMSILSAKEVNHGGTPEEELLRETGVLVEACGCSSN